MRFDHIGLALRRPDRPLAAHGRRAGRPATTAAVAKAGYGWTQLRFANGFVVEGLQPRVPRGHRLPRPLPRRRSGPGPHHLTFHVGDLDAGHRRAAVRRRSSRSARTARDPGWLESRSSIPSRAPASWCSWSQAAEPPAEILDEPEGFPETSFDHPMASLGRVVHAVADLPAALVAVPRRCSAAGSCRSGAAVDGNHWVELGWGGPGRLRLLEAVHAEIAEWVGDRPGRLRHLFFDFDEPSHVPGAHQVASGPRSVGGRRRRRARHPPGHRLQRPLSRPLLEQHPAVDDGGRAGDPRRCVRGEEQRCVGDVGGLAEPVQRHHLATRRPRWTPTGHVPCRSSPDRGRSR
ncbi:MAG: hypothetical protein V9E94_13405 [Microthrixaceae bacterium]